MIPALRRVKRRGKISVTTGDGKKQVLFGAAMKAGFTTRAKPSVKTFIATGRTTSFLWPN